jgi:hypothetical protein
MRIPMAPPEVGVRRLKAFAVPLSLVLAAVAPAGAQAPPPGQASAPAAPASAVEDEIVRYMAVSRPGPEHRWLDPLVGSWNVELRWLGTGQTETRTSGTSENRWILGGRFLVCEATAGEGPSRVDATTILGFDNREKRFFALGMHNLASSYLAPTGSYDPATQSFLLSGKERDEVTGGVLVYRELLKMEGPDRHVLRVYLDLNGRTPVRVLEAVYTRR